MTAPILLILFIVLYSAEFLTNWLLSAMNLNSIIRNRDKVPEIFAKTIDKNTYRKSVSYSLAKGRFSLLSMALSFLFLLVIVISGLPGMIEGVLTAFIPEGRFFSIIYIFAVSILFSALSFPLSFYSQFVIEQEFGFNKTGLKLYFADALKQTILSVVLMVPLLWVLFFFMDTTGSFWWIYASGFIVAFQLIIFLLYPVVIAPLFNKFTPLEEGSLKTRLQGLAERCGFGASGIFVMDGSRRSGHSNAYFTGLGRFRRIVLFDTLVDSLSEEELEAVLAHEIGHNKLKHIPKMLITSIIILCGALFITSLCMNWDALYHAFGFSGPTYHGILTILLYLASPFSFFLGPLGNRRSRKHEYQADAYACNAVEDGSALQRALLALSRDNLSNLTPHRLYSAFYYSHPALAERLEAMEKLKIEKAAESGLEQ